MSHWEKQDGSDEYYSPRYIFDALGVRFDMDVAAPKDRQFCHVPADRFICEDSLERKWRGFVWMNPPFSGRNSKELWLNKMYLHGNGIALVPDRTSAPWWPQAARQCDALLCVTGKVKFIRPDGSSGGSPGNGTTLFGYGDQAVEALIRAEDNGLGILLKHFYNGKSNTTKGLRASGES